MPRRHQASTVMPHALRIEDIIIKYKQLKTTTMGFFSKKNECPEIGKTIECATFHLETMQKGGNVKLRIESNYIEVQDLTGTKRIQWKFSKKDGTKFYFEGTNEFHQWIIGSVNITHTSENGNQMYIRLDAIKR